MLFIVYLIQQGIRVQRNPRPGESLKTFFTVAAERVSRSFYSQQTRSIMLILICFLISIRAIKLEKSSA